MKDTGLHSKVVIVTGAAAGIGRATARRFASEGCRVAAWDVNDAGQEELLRELSSLGRRGALPQSQRLRLTPMSSLPSRKLSDGGAALMCSSITRASRATRSS